MKMKGFFLIFFLIFFAGNASGVDSDPDIEVWWKIEFLLSVNGDYQYRHNNNNYDGKYSFKIMFDAAMEYDYSKDYILYPGEKKITALNWKEIVLNEKEGYKRRDLSNTIEPDIRLNYVLKEKGKLYFDFETFLKTPILENSDPFKKFLLPRSAQNKTINRQDKYNNYVKKGSNGVQLPIKLILNQRETIKEFYWQWQWNKDAFKNSHSVEIKIKINKKIRNLPSSD